MTHAPKSALDLGMGYRYIDEDNAHTHIHTHGHTKCTKTKYTFSKKYDLENKNNVFAHTDSFETINVRILSVYKFVARDECELAIVREQCIHSTHMRIRFTAMIYLYIKPIYKHDL